MNEIEICLKSKLSFDKLIELMKSKGFKVQDDFQMNDTYLIPKIISRNMTYL